MYNNMLRIFFVSSFWHQMPVLTLSDELPQLDTTGSSRMMYMLQQETLQHVYVREYMVYDIIFNNTYMHVCVWCTVVTIGYPTGGDGISVTRLVFGGGWMCGRMHMHRLYVSSCVNVWCVMCDVSRVMCWYFWYFSSAWRLRGFLFCTCCVPLVVWYHVSVFVHMSLAVHNSWRYRSMRRSIREIVEVRRHMTAHYT